MTRHNLGRLLAVPLLAAGLFAAAALPASSTPGHHPMPPGPHRAHRGHFLGHFGVFRADINPIPDVPAKVGFSHVRGHAVLVRFGDKVAIFVELHGLAPNLPHLQHLHGFITNNKVTQASTCPTAANDTNHDGIVSTPEGATSYGPIQVSLTTSGDTTPASGFAFDRFPVADSHGVERYVRIFTVGKDIPAVVADHLGEFAIANHGIDINHNGRYDFGAGASFVMPTLSLESTVPNSCGPVNTLGP